MAGQHNNIKGPSVGKFTNVFIPPVVSVSPFDTMKASWQGGSFPVTLKFLYVLQSKCVVSLARGSI